MKGNTVSIKGNITRDAEIRKSPSGGNVVKFGIAWNQSKSDGNGGYVDIGHFFDVTMFPTDRQLAMLEEHLVTGARCAIVDGHLDFHEWEKDGQKRSKVQIIVDDPIGGFMVDGSGKRQEAGTSVYDEDIPF